MKTTSAGKRISMISLGCPKALVDSERILTQLRTEGYEIGSTYDDAELVVINTCGFIDSAIEESLSTIGEALQENGRVIVTGCLGANKEKILDKYPNVLSVTGPHAYEEVIQSVHQYAPPSHNAFIDLVPPQGIKLTPRHYAYLKISEGCNHRCSFCIIPHLRGDLVSRPVGEILDEAQKLADAGVRELMIISQDTSAYGVDLRYRTGFWQGQPVKSNLLELCENLGQLGIWVRLHYVYPYPNVDKLMPLMAERKILPYLDIPFQHSSPDVLKKMKRPAHTEDSLRRIELWRSQVPDLTLRSTFIVGFPGETEADFEHLLQWLDAAQLDRVGCFKYSPVEGAPANDLGLPQISDEVKEERWARFMEKQAQISAARLQKKIGTTLHVLVDEIRDDKIIGRSWADAPEIDGEVIIENEWDLNPGDVFEAKVLDADDYDLYAEPV
ncbi:MAG TPA: 30S ribosomal protein S12 methylthiotransferase RimO [Pseudomonadales bacterium]|nr:30S ribosomal protein S12 methylthiotransferase RimO [Pseudomonadales bacterium]